ncbi:TPA: RluA family pseudouridine synthase [Klebsiella pneumoniae]|uniref:RluA family pseudouridine synthase n=1 Tax=Klebsiella pneumoniae TaxID=573 RepID=UPI0025537DB2|nr:RluA family pseudouridine synthase [Klebsiella pneumoniae]MDK9879806.1 RluA family pseudouridine synthase [Klebsiella pneumoniae]HCL6305029.1 RluA family pseudouridine synthase [Klebsiella pneumoniae]
MSTIIDTFVAPPCREQITLLYQDEHLLLINKPAGLLSLSGKDPRNLDSVHHRLVQRFPGCTLVHRLDFGTSGLMVIARNKGINALLCQQFSQRTVDKVYTALLCGHLAEDEGIVEAAIAKDPAREGERALALTRVTLTPETGRTHQLRIHCQLLGYPILGCDLYGGRELPGTEQAPRLMLHASELRFVHPVSHEPMHIQQASPF